MLWSYPPSGDKQLLQLTKEIVSIAPEIPEWEFHGAKPPKEWDLRFVVEDRRGKPVAVDASNWEYVLLKLPEGSFNVMVRAENLKDLDNDTKQVAAEIAVEGVVGEMTRLHRIAGVEVVREFNDIDRRKSTILKHLGDHLRSLTSE